MEFQEAIREDLKVMGVIPDQVTFTSDHFEELHKFAIQLIESGNGYMDDTPQETVKLHSPIPSF